MYEQNERRNEQKKKKKFDTYAHMFHIKITLANGTRISREQNEKKIYLNSKLTCSLG